MKLINHLSNIIITFVAIWIYAVLIMGAIIIWSVEAIYKGVMYVYKCFYQEIRSIRRKL